MSLKEMQYICRVNYGTGGYDVTMPVACVFKLSKNATGVSDTEKSISTEK